MVDMIGMVEWLVVGGGFCGCDAGYFPNGVRELAMDYDDCDWYQGRKLLRREST